MPAQQTRVQKAGSVIKNIISGAVSGLPLGLMGAIGGAVLGGSADYLTMTPDKKEKTVNAAKRIQELRANKNLSSKEKKEMDKILKNYPFLKDEKTAKTYADPVQLQNNLAQLQGSEESGYPAQELRFQRFTPEQQQAMSSVLQNSLSGLGQNKFDFSPIEEKARADYAQKTIPSIAERFTKFGAQKSSAFPQLLSQSAKDLETELGALRANYGLTQQQALHNLLQIGLTPQYSSTFFAGQPGTGQGTAKSLGEILTNPNTIDLFKQGFSGVQNLWNARKEKEAKKQEEAIQQALAQQAVSFIPPTINPSAPSVSGMEAMYPAMTQNPYAPTATPEVSSGFTPPEPEPGSWLRNRFSGMQ